MTVFILSPGELTALIGLVSALPLILLGVELREGLQRLSLRGAVTALPVPLSCVGECLHLFAGRVDCLNRAGVCLASDLLGDWAATGSPEAVAAGGGDCLTVSLRILKYTR